MKQILTLAGLALCAGLAQAQESPYEWGHWAIDREQPQLSGYDVEDYDHGVVAHVPMASDLENSFTPVGPVESTLNDVGGTVNDIIAQVLERDPTASLNDILNNLPSDLGNAGNNVNDIVNDVVDALP